MDKKTIITNIVLLFLILGAILAYLYVSGTGKKIFGNDTTTTETTTTSATTETTTTTAATTAAKNNRLLSFTSIKDYSSISKKYTRQGRETVTDNGYLHIDPDLYTRCKRNGEKTSFNQSGFNISYECVVIDESTSDYKATVKIDDKYIFEDATDYGCSSHDYLFNKNNDKYYIFTSGTCSTGAPHIFKIYDKNNKELIKVDIQIGIYNGEMGTGTSYSVSSTPMIIKDNILYYIEADNKTIDAKTTCRIKYIDLEADSIKPVDMGVSGDCIYISGE